MVSCCAAAVVAVCLAMCASLPRAAATKILLLSDLHLDPYYGTNQAMGHCVDDTAPTYGRPGCDAPLVLVASAINTSVPLQDDGLIVLSGDWMRHEMADVQDPGAATTAIFNTICALFADAGARVVPHPMVDLSLGNNDFVPDYHFDLANPTHPLLQNITDILVSHNLLTANESDTFARCAYYTRDFPNSDLTFVTLNTLVWAESLDPPTTLEDPCGQFEWLNNTLASARDRNRRVYIVSHIPPGVNTWDYDHPHGNDDDEVFWKAPFYVKYALLVAQFSDIIAEQIFGHTHHFSYSAIKTSRFSDNDAFMAAPVWIMPSITPEQGNNPSFFIGEVDSRWTITSLQQYSFNETTVSWDPKAKLPEYFDIPDLTPLSLSGLSTRLFTDDELWQKFLTLNNGGTAPSAGSCGEHCRHTVTCSMVLNTTHELPFCLRGPTTAQPIAPHHGPDDTISRHVALALFAGSVVLLLSVGAFIVHRRRRNMARHALVPEEPPTPSGLQYL